MRKDCLSGRRDRGKGGAWSLLKRSLAVNTVELVTMQVSGSATHPQFAGLSAHVMTCDLRTQRMHFVVDGMIKKEYQIKESDLE